MDNFLRNVGALNDETRVKILRFIAQNGEVCVCKIEEAFDMIQSRISRHLKILKDAGFLNVDRRGKWAYYAIRQNLDPFQKTTIEYILTLDIALPKSCFACASK